MYRDVKAENIGFDVGGVVKIFDVALMREFDPEEASEDGTYQLTGQTGSTLYMAPEVALGKPYNESVDVYSFSILLWQILHMETPFRTFTQKMFDRCVVQQGVRPKCNARVVPSQLSNLMSRGWHADWKHRPTMEEMARELRDEIYRKTGEDIAPDNNQFASVDCECRSELSDSLS